MKKHKDKYSLENLLEIMEALRDPHRGCPWDREQTFETIAPYTIEEAYEVADAIERRAFDELAGELGDLLLQVVYHARMAEEAGMFGFGDVVEAICEKMVRRHPHVFGDERIDTAASQTAAWERMKRDERRSAEPGGSALDGIPVNLPALLRGAKLGQRAARLGFDWPDIGAVREKLDEELAELDEAAAVGAKERIAAEVGDVLFTVVNLCRHWGLDPESTLRAANRRFETRFRRVEARIAASGTEWEDVGLETLERLWQEAKREK